jgi:hypothetical protein
MEGNIVIEKRQEEIKTDEKERMEVRKIYKQIRRKDGRKKEKKKENI